MTTTETNPAPAPTRTLTPRRERRGLGIVELGLYLIVVALLVSSIVLAFYQLQTNARQTRTSALVNEAYAAVQDLHRSATSYGADGLDLLPILEGAEMLPSIGRRDPDGRPDSGDELLFTPFGERVTIVAGGANGIAGQSFTITLINYTRANCIDYMSGFADRTLEQSGLLGATSNGAVIPFPATVAAINATCADGDLALEFR